MFNDLKLLQINFCYNRRIKKKPAIFIISYNFQTTHRTVILNNYYHTSIV